MLSLQGFAQQTPLVDFISINAEVYPNNLDKTVRGNVFVKFKTLQQTDSVFLDAKNMHISNASNSNITVSASDNKIWFTGDFKQNKVYELAFSYQVTPKKALYFTPTQIWTQGQGKYTSHWLPSLDDMNDKITFDLTILAPENKTVIANGKLKATSKTAGLKKWEFDMTHPMSSYLVAFAIGDYTKKTMYTSSQVPIELYIKPEDSLKFEPTYRYTQEIFNFLETEIGVSYPWQNYKEVPVRDFLYAGMENTTATFFSEAFVVDSIGFTDRNYITVNAHELAHQWFGNLITETNSEHHWLHEGFATYYALLAEKKILGDDYYYWKLYNSAEQLKQQSDAGKGEALLNPKASSLTFYEKGAWALHILREKVGDQIFKQAVKNYLTKNAFKNVTTQDFLSEIETGYKKPLTNFKENWLQQTAFKTEEAYNSLLKSPFIKSYFKLVSLREQPLSQKKETLSQALNNHNDYLGQEVVYQLALENYEDVKDLYLKAFKTTAIYTRQALAFSLEKIPNDLRYEYETLLQDKSYLTIEAALYNLWKTFPDGRTKYLDHTQHIIGFQNKNVRQLWLALAIITPEYQPVLKQQFITELKSYTSPIFSFEIRQKAFEYCSQLNLVDPSELNNLLQANTHPNWQFKKFSRNLLETLLEDETFIEKIRQNKQQLSQESLDYLKDKL
jgi:aminopeptidase N